MSERAWRVCVRHQSGVRFDRKEKTYEPICFRHVRVYPQKQALADARVDWVDYSTKGSDQEFVALYLGAKAKDEPLELDQGLDVLKKLGFIDVNVVYDVLIEDYDEEVVDDIMKRLGFERSV